MSNINYSAIDGTYPTPGQDNPSSGMRDNFANIKSGLKTAAEEISVLQDKSAQAGRTNEFEFGTIANVVVRGYTEYVYDHGTVTTDLTLEYGDGGYQQFTPGQSIQIDSITADADASGVQFLHVGISCTNVNYTVTWPNEVSADSLSKLASTSGRITKFNATGYYEYRLITDDNGTTWTIYDSGNSPKSHYGNLTVYGNANTEVVSITTTHPGNGAPYGTLTANAITVNGITWTGNVDESRQTLQANVMYTPDFANTVANLTYSNSAVHGLYGYVRTASQPAITTLGTQTALYSVGSVEVGYTGTATGNANATLTSYGMTDICGNLMTSVWQANIINGGTYVVNQNGTTYLVRPDSTIGNTIATATIEMPPTSNPGQRITLAFSGTITALTMTAPAGNVYGALTTANVSSGGTWFGFENNWYRAG